MSPDIKRVLTGRDAANKSVFAAVGATPRVITFDTLPGIIFWEMYATESVPALSGREPDPVPGLGNLIPSPRGSRFRVVQFPARPAEARQPTPAEIEKMKKEVAEKIPGFGEHFEWDNFPMHTTDTLDYGVVIRGEIMLELDDGKTTHLKQGDCVVQNGTRHRWSNPLAEPCLMCFIMIGAKRGSG